MDNTVAGLDTAGSGSYAAEDVQFLLRPVRVRATAVEEKERLLQSGQKHYSEMISQESAPSAVHQALYERALIQNGPRMAAAVESLALALNVACLTPEIVLVSLVRAGLPLGVLLRRALVARERIVHHYAVSIIRDRGIDRVALEFIIRRHGAEAIVFVDGWTGKGAIAGEISRSLKNDSRFPVDPRLVVLADPCGRAWLSASNEDWLIPCGILGATVSGLVSRSIWPTDDGLHGCVVYQHLHGQDVSRAFIEQIETQRKALSGVAPATFLSHGQRDALQALATGVVNDLASGYDITDINRIKPGIAEATRAVLRRVPERVLVRDRGDRDVQLLMHLTDRAGITVEERGIALGPYRAATLIRRVC